jgi:hypothetical protein
MRPLVYSDTITVRTDADLRRAINAAARRENTTASDWLRKAVATIVATDGSPLTPAPDAPAAAMPMAA